jgi:exopolysaccharide/PEP-CTERM locus tyrosine autokinase
MMDAASRSLIERAAAHLKRRNEAQAAQPLVANADWGNGTAAPVQPARAARPQPQAAAAMPEAAAAPQPQQRRRRTAPPPESTAHSRQVSIDRAALRQHGIALPSAGRSRIAEEFRIVKRQIVAKFLDEVDGDPEAARNRVIMVTSAKPGEGKTFAAINLALSIASEQDLKVLLIDLDTRSHAMQDMMGIPAGRGLTDLLSNPDVDFADVVLRTNMPNLAVMPAGHPDNRGPELLSSKRTREMFEEMTQRYSDRFIIFDAPSCLASSDPATLASLVGQVVFVVEADQTQQEEVEAAVALVRGCPNISLLLNKVRASATDQFGSYSNY